MDSTLVAEIESLRRTAERLERAGLIVDRTALSQSHRRALFALQCAVGDSFDEPEPKRALIGFEYPNAR
jgi:hypothetical protein